MHKIERFWLVWNPNGRNPTYRHTTRESAQIEAERLAALNPRQSFFVLKAAGGALANQPVAVPFKMVAAVPDHEVPF